MVVEALYVPFPYDAPDITHSASFAEFVLVIPLILAGFPSETEGDVNEAGGHSISVVVKFETVNLL